MPTGVYKRTKEMKTGKHMTGRKLSVKTKKKIKNTLKGRPVKNKIGGWNKGLKVWWTGEKHPYWKGDKVGYSGLHRWVYQKLGKPQECWHCSTKTARKFEWANRSGKYKRELFDWIRLCTKCHRAWDKQLIEK